MAAEGLQWQHSIPQPDLNILLLGLRIARDRTRAHIGSYKDQGYNMAGFFDDIQVL